MSTQATVKVRKVNKTIFWKQAKQNSYCLQIKVLHPRSHYFGSSPEHTSVKCTGEINWHHCATSNMHYFIETLFHPLEFHLGSFVSRRRDTWGYIIHIQVLLELITESSLSLSPEPPAAGRGRAAARPPEESTSPGPCLEPRLAGLPGGG